MVPVAKQIAMAIFSVQFLQMSISIQFTQKYQEKCLEKTGVPSRGSEILQSRESSGNIMSKSLRLLEMAHWLAADSASKYKSSRDFDALPFGAGPTIRSSHSHRTWKNGQRTGN